MFFGMFNYIRDDDYWCWGLSAVPYKADDSKNYTGRVILPQSILEDLVMQNIQPPYTFNISSDATTISTFCGVLEFTGTEGVVFVPRWIYQQLALDQSNQVTMKYATAPSGTFIKLRPHSTDFLEIESPKAEMEKALCNYQMLSCGDEILLYFEEQGPMRFTVEEIRPEGDAIYIVDTDIKVDFLPPIGYEEKVKMEKSVKSYVRVEVINDKYKKIVMKKPGLFFGKRAEVV